MKLSLLNLDPSCSLHLSGDDLSCMNEASIADKLLPRGSPDAPIAIAFASPSSGPTDVTLALDLPLPGGIRKFQLATPVSDVTEPIIYSPTSGNRPRSMYDVSRGDTRVTSPAVDAFEALASDKYVTSRQLTSRPKPLRAQSMILPTTSNEKYALTRGRSSRPVLRESHTVTGSPQPTAALAHPTFDNPQSNAARPRPSSMIHMISRKPPPSAEGIFSTPTFTRLRSISETTRRRFSRPSSASTSVMGGVRELAEECEVAFSPITNQHLELPVDPSHAELIETDSKDEINWIGQVKTFAFRVRRLLFREKGNSVSHFTCQW